MPRTVAALCFVAALAATDARAQNVSLTFADGRVTLRTRNASARQILAEWARQADVQVVGAERLGGPPLTIQLENVPESKALEVVLRNASGYILAPRAAAERGLSVIDRIFVLPVSTASSAPPPPQRRAGPQPFTPPPVFNAPTDDPNAPPDPDAPPAEDTDEAAAAEPAQPGDPAPVTPATAPEAFGVPPGPAPLPSFAAPPIPGQEQSGGAESPAPVIVPRPGVLPAPRQQQPPPPENPPDPQ